MNSESQIIRTEYSELMKKSYIDYAMSVIIVMISLTGSVPVLSEIPWVNTIRMETVRSMMHL